MLFKSFMKQVKGLPTEGRIQHLWDYATLAWAGKLIDQWATKVMRSKIEPMKREVKTVRRHKVLILNWFIAKKALVFWCSRIKTNEYREVVFL